MRRVLTLILCLGFLALPAQAAGGQEYVALTFDDGPSGRFTRTLLDGLQERGVEATFLLCGYRMEQYPDITQRMVDEGHEIGLWVLTFFSYDDEQNIGTLEYHTALQALRPYVQDEADGHVLLRGLTLEEMKQVLAQAKQV